MTGIANSPLGIFVSENLLLQLRSSNSLKSVQTFKAL